MPDPVPATPATETTPPAGSPEADAAAIAQFDAAMASDPETTPLPEGEPPDTIKPAEPVAAGEEAPPEGEETPPEGEEPPVDGEEPPEPVAAAAPPVEPVPPVALTPEAAAKVAEAAAKADIEKEIKDRGLKGDTATRFRELSNQVRELAPLREEMPRLREVERLHTQWQGLVADSTASAPQLEQALAYIQSVNSGDPARLAQAAKAMMEEVKWAYTKLGWELPGVVDPLAAHADLNEAVEDGSMTRAGALEVAAARALAASTTARNEADTQTRARAQAEQTAIGQINVISDRLKAEDPLFAQKLPHLKPTVDLIKSSLPPAQWPAAIERAYRALPNPAPAPRPRTPAPGPMPLRPTGGNSAATTTVRKFTKQQVDAGDPFDMGVREATGK